MGVHRQKFFQNTNLDDFFSTRSSSQGHSLCLKSLSVSFSTPEIPECCHFDSSRGSGLCFRRSMVSFAFFNAHLDWLICLVLHFVVTGNDQQPYLFKSSCPRLPFSGLCPLSLGLLEILLPQLGRDPQLNWLLPPVPLLTNYSALLIRTFGRDINSIHLWRFRFH